MENNRLLTKEEEAAIWETVRDYFNLTGNDYLTKYPGVSADKYWNGEDGEGLLKPLLDVMESIKSETLNSLSAQTDEKMVEEIAILLWRKKHPEIEYSEWGWPIIATQDVSSGKCLQTARKIHSKISSVYEARLKQQEAETCKKMGEWMDKNYIDIDDNVLKKLLSGRPPWNE